MIERLEPNSDSFSCHGQPSLLAYPFADFTEQAGLKVRPSTFFLL
jgi:hypothetical protein